MAKKPFTEDNHMIEAVPPDRTDQPFRVSILPRRPRRTRSIPDTHCLKRYLRNVNYADECR